MNKGAISLLNTMHLTDLEIAIDDLVLPKLSHEEAQKYISLRREAQLVQMALENGYEFSWKNVYQNDKGSLCRDDFKRFPELGKEQNESKSN